MRDSASWAESKDLDSAIFAEQKSNQMCSAVAHTAPRPCRGGENREKGGSSATTTIALEVGIARHSRQKIYFVAAKKEPTGCK